LNGKLFTLVAQKEEIEIRQRRSAAVRIREH
jgi:hypothetical protein